MEGFHGDPRGALGNGSREQSALTADREEHGIQHLLIALILTGFSAAAATPPPLEPNRDPAAAVGGPGKGYRLKVFSPHEFATITALSETILRNNDMRGAHEARVNEFIDFQLTYDPEMQARFHNGLKWLDETAELRYGKKFRRLKTHEQQEMVAALDIRSLHRPGEELGREFFELARRYTYNGFYASKDALKRFVAPKPLVKIAPSTTGLAGSVKDDAKTKN